MSFILEALKKSEQQRQQQTTPAKTVHKRTLSLKASSSGRRRFPWLVSGLLFLILLCGWWYYAQTSQSAAPEVSQSTAPAPPQIVATPEAEVKVTPPESLPQEPTETALKAQSDLPQLAITVEPSPVPRALGLPKTTQPDPLPQREPFATTERNLQTIDPPVETLVVSQPEPVPGEQEFSPSSGRLPLYAELSGELRGRMPAINMSMHFYNKESGRRLVRINDLLLHEGDWVTRDLQLVEINGDGVTLDFLGKMFSLPRNRR